ncbi:MAG: aromatic ring-hydroxylating dioxygenase subunit alpha [Planctomycetia bacterium]|nr:aromatic ring-hydroxylating dioxygenase subunit alpha [Planctomycetia bacterium]
MQPVTEALYDCWYLAIPGRQLKRGRTLRKMLLGKSVLLGRDSDGVVFALVDICPHRGIPLSHGKFDGKEIECCYHGWKFDCSGTCTHIPSLLSTQKFELDRVHTGNFPCREVQGNIWVYIPQEKNKLPEALPEIPLCPQVDASHYRMVEHSVFNCSIDQAVIGLMDPAHGPFVHQSWWWRTAKTMHEKSKEFAPSNLGFTMVRHRPSSNSKVYQLLGAEVFTEIRFELPGSRIEHISVGKHSIVGLTSLTPLTADQAELHQVFYWTFPWLGVIKPFMRHFVRTFIEQDRKVVGQQATGLNEDPALILINDADKPARWYYALKKELIQSRTEGRPFVNPVPHTTLRWRT